jgi:chromate transporter
MRQISDNLPIGSAVEVFFAFLKLGLTSFGGPIAHLGYFRSEFVARRRWLDERAYADIVALAQFLPGPASSQAGFAIGLTRAGYAGGAAAWLGFTMPSVLLMLAFAAGLRGLADTAVGNGLLHGLKLVAVAIVAQAVLGMARSLCPDRQRATIAVLALALVVALPGSAGQLGAIAAGGLLGLVLCRRMAVEPHAAAPLVSRRAGLVFLVVFFILLAVAFVPAGRTAFGLFDAFYRSGALVFGGGHVVLPLLRDAVVVPGWTSDNAFLAGYGMAQAVPGPLFTFAAYLGAVIDVPPGGVAGAAIALLAIFLPGLLALMGALPFWQALRSRPRAQAAMAGINAAVVGLLGAAFYSPVWISAVHSPADFAVAAAAFVALVVWRAPPLLAVVACAVAGVALGLG